MRQSKIIVIVAAGVAVIILLIAYTVTSNTAITLRKSPPLAKDGKVRNSDDLSAVPLDKDFPSDFPLIKGKVTASMKYNTVKGEEGEFVGMSQYVQVRTKLPIEQAIDFYKPKFSKITKQTPLKSGTEMLSGYIGKHTASIHFTKRPDGTLVTIIIAAEKRN